jgi:hypothetical protein
MITDWLVHSFMDLGFVRDGEFLDKLSIYQFLKMGSTPWSFLVVN